MKYKNPQMEYYLFFIYTRQHIPLSGKLSRGGDSLEYLSQIFRLFRKLFLQTKQNGFNKEKQIISQIKISPKVIFSQRCISKF